MIVSVFPGGFRVSCSTCGETTKLFVNAATLQQKPANLPNTVKVECSFTDTQSAEDSDVSMPERKN